MGGDVGGRLVGDLAEVAERELVEPERLVVRVEGAPAAAARLHPGRPREAAVDGVAPAVAAAQGERDHCGVVDVGIEIVLELEGPAAGRELGAAHGPVAAHGDLLVLEPLGRAHERGVLGAETRVAQRQHGEAGVPDRRLAGLGPEAAALVDDEPFPALDRSAQGLVLEAVAERDQHQDRPDPWRLDPAPRAVRLLVGPHPALCLPERSAAKARGPRRRLALARAGADLA